jgi:hypothetical protein
MIIIPTLTTGKKLSSFMIHHRPILEARNSSLIMMVELSPKHSKYFQQEQKQDYGPVLQFFSWTTMENILRLMVQTFQPE